jgi:hypothetical protein
MIEVDLVVSSWPFRTGVIIYDPVLELDIIEWNLQEVAARPDIWTKLQPGLDLFQNYSPRANFMLDILSKKQDYLTSIYQERPVQLRLSRELEDSLTEFAKPYQIALEELLSINQLEKLQQRLADWHEEKQRRFTYDYLETFEMPVNNLSPDHSSAPTAPLYESLEDSARAFWLCEQQTPVEDLSLGTILRVELGKRESFTREKAISFTALNQLKNLK